MRLLLDTHVVLWQLAGTRDLCPEVAEAIEAADDLLFSAASYAEIGVKVAAGKLELEVEGLPRLVEDLGVRTLGLNAAHGLHVARLPLHHRDPFDRLIIAQASAEDLTVVSADTRFSDYDIALLAA